MVTSLSFSASPALTLSPSAPWPQAARDSAIASLKPFLSSSNFGIKNARIVIVFDTGHLLRSRLHAELGGFPFSA